ncbi:MAG TPA: PHP domain-containing protein [Acidimicrobiales bacterium]|nr:PHP domain-containing protein [Acidimicrobiales bacterium]
MDPVDALRRIAYRLEADRAESYKVRAFRRAAAAVADTDPDRLADLAATGRLQRLDGVGETTARVVAEALAGEVPAYLVHLEGEARPELTGAAAEVRALLQGDCHSHSDWSDGGSPVVEMAEAARDLGHAYLALTDHSPRLTVAHGLDAERLVAQLDLLDRLNEELAPFRVLTGIEVDILEDGSLDQDEGLLARLDVVVASVHSKLKMEPAQMTARMVAAIESPHTDILGHCTGRIIVGRGRPESRFDAAAVFDACAATGTAVEINSRPERRDPPEPLLRHAVEAGCYVSIDTDAHAPGQLEWLTNGCEQAVAAGVPLERIVNGWPADRLLGWTAGHAA